MRLAADVGSDVPFFMTKSPAAICRGRGERIERLAAPCYAHYVIVRPPQGLATKSVYQRTEVTDVPRKVDPVTRDIRKGMHPDVRGALFNRLESPARQLCPWIDRLDREFSRSSVVAHQMSGSGTSYFGVCHHAFDAMRIAHRLRARRVGHVIQATTVPAYPVIRRLTG